MQGRKLSEVINETKENPKYLPGVSLGDTLTAVPDLAEAVKDADVLVFCAPHQFVHGVCKQLAGKVRGSWQLPGVHTFGSLHVVCLHL